MKSSIHRRQFLGYSASLGLCSGMIPGVLSAKHHKSERFTLGLSQYSLRALLRDGSLDALDFPQFTVDQFGINAIDLWEGGLPKDKLDDAKYLAKMRSKADQAGTDLFLLMYGALDASKEKREASSVRISKSFDRASQLGAPNWEARSKDLLILTELASRFSLEASNAPYIKRKRSVPA